MSVTAQFSIVTRKKGKKASFKPIDLTSGLTKKDLVELADDGKLSLTVYGNESSDRDEMEKVFDHLCDEVSMACIMSEPQKLSTPKNGQDVFVYSQVSLNTVASMVLALGIAPLS